MYTGETFSTREATELFFGTTKLFQHKDPALRQSVYVAIKELALTAEDVIIVTSSITKDMQTQTDAVYRPNAIRALVRIIDPSLVHNLERYFKAAIVEKSTSISSAALVSSYQLFPVSKEVIKRWVNEVQEAVQLKPASNPFSGLGGGGGLNLSSAGGYLGFGSSAPATPVQPTIPSTSNITQYHALALLYVIRQQDRMAVTKMIQQFGGGRSGAGGLLKNPMAICMLIRFAVKVMDEDPNLQKQMVELLEGLIRHKSDMVTFEASRALCEMRNVTAAQLTKPMAQMMLFLSSTKPTLRFAAMRTLSALALTHPTSVATCNVEMENLISDSNRSIATYAITTLLKTGNEASVDRLMKSITGFMSEISDEFKVIVVDAIRSLCLKFPNKQSQMLTFLSSILRDEGGYDFKRAVVEAIFDMIKFISESKEAALAHLCEFIEDCEFTKLSVRVLHLLGIEGPKAPNPTKYIRYIYNRVVLENAIVRAAAVTSLAKFGVCGSDPTIKRSVSVLLSRCLDDIDDEVRDRAAMYLRVMKEDALAEPLVKEDSVYSLATLESKLAAYVSNPDAQNEEFDISSIPKISRAQAQQEAARPTTLETFTASVVPQPKANVPAPAAPSAQETQSAYASQLAAIPNFSGYGSVLTSSPKPTPLTETETEYVVTCVKHIFKEHIVFQFNVANTIPDTVLENVSVVMQPSAEGVEEDFIIPVDSLDVAAGSQPVYVSFTRTDPEEYPLGSFACTLKFVSKEVDPSSGLPEETGYDDEYQLEEVELSVGGDYIVPNYCSFETEWVKLGEESGAEEEFALNSMSSIKEACDSLINLLGMEALAGSDHPSSTAVHTLLLSGLVVGGGGKVLARCQMAYTASTGVSLRLSVRAEKPEISQLVIAAIG